MNNIIKVDSLNDLQYNLKSNTQNIIIIQEKLIDDIGIIIISKILSIYKKHIVILDCGTSISYCISAIEEDIRHIIINTEKYIFSSLVEMIKDKAILLAEDEEKMFIYLKKSDILKAD